MIRFPKTITRRPRPIDDRSFYKASEFLNFLLYYGGACVEGILPQKYLNHFNLLSSALFTFSKDSFSTKEFATAENKLYQFHAEFSQLYKDKNMVYNTHLLTHIPNCVKNWGPVWTFSNFPFEDYNGVLKNFVSGTSDVEQQIASEYLLTLEMQRLNLPFWNEISASKKAKNFEKVALLYLEMANLRQQMQKNTWVLFSQVYQMWIWSNVTSVA